MPVHNAYVCMIPYGTVRYCTTLPSANIHRVYAFCPQMYGSTGIVQNRTALHKLLLAVATKERKIVNSNDQRLLPDTLNAKLSSNVCTVRKLRLLYHRNLH